MNRRLAIAGVVLVLSFSAAISYATAAAQPSQPTRFTVEVQGSGPAVILIPGLACSRAVYQQEAAKLTAHYRLYLVQINGFAGAPADANASGPLLAPVTAELAQYIEANHIEKPAIIGHSLGGLLGLMLAADHPGDVGRLMVVDAFPFFPAAFNPTATPEQFAPQAAAMRQKIISESDAEFARSEAAALSRMVMSPPNLKLVTGWALASDRSVVAQAMYDDMTTDMRPKLADIHAPVTVLYPWNRGMGLRRWDDNLYQSAYATARNAWLVRIDNSRHFIMLDQPQAFDAAVRQFLQ